jgi:endo-alpha-1,4-polygalactosaminidase (GH114 family)
MKKTAVEWLVNEIPVIDWTDPYWKVKLEQAKEMEKKEKIEFACQVAEASAEKYIQGKTTWQIAEELLTFKSE